MTSRLGSLTVIARIRRSFQKLASELRVSRHALADDKSLFRFDGSQKEFLSGAVFFPEHDSEQRHAAHSNHRPCRRLGDRRKGQTVGTIQPGGEGACAARAEFQNLTGAESGCRGALNTYVQVATGIECQAARRAQPGREDVLGAARGELKDLVAVIEAVEVAGGVKGQTERTGQSGGEGAPCAAGSELVNLAAATIGFVEVTAGVKGQPPRCVQPRRENALGAARGELQNLATGVIVFEEITAGVKGQARRSCEARGEDGFDAARGHLRNLAVASIAHEKVAAGVEGQADRKVQSGGKGACDAPGVEL